MELLSSSAIVLLSSLPCELLQEFQAVHAHVQCKQTRQDISGLHMTAVAYCIAHGTGKKQRHDRTCGQQHHVSSEGMRGCGQHAVLCCSILYFAMRRMTL